MRHARAALFFVACMAQVGSMVECFAAAPTTVPTPGLRENTPQVFALVGAKVVVAPDQTLDKATVIVRDGVIVEVGPDVTAPADATIFDYAGKTIYAGLIDAYAEQSSRSADDSAGAAYWNRNVTPERSAAKSYTADQTANRKLRSQGITARLLAPASGIIQGTSALVTTGDDAANRTILAQDVALHVVLSPNRGASGYPRSPMGALTLVRQAFYDADWYTKAWTAFEADPALVRPERNEALAALAPVRDRERPLVIRTADELYFLRADQVAREFDLDLIVVGSGEEYQRLDAIRAAAWRVIVPVDFPRKPNVTSPETAMSATLEDLMHWDLAPENLARLIAAGVPIAITTRGLRDTAEFLAAVRKAVARGLPREAALAALTTAPAEWFGMAHRIGTIAKSKAANLVVASGDLFDRKTKIVATWVDGRRYKVESAPDVDLRGRWKLRLTRADGGSESLVLGLAGEPEKLTGDLLRGDRKATLKDVAFRGSQFSASVDGKPLGWDGVVRLSLTVLADREEAVKEARLHGELTLADGSRWPIDGSFDGDYKRAGDDKKSEDDAEDADEDASDEDESKEDKGQSDDTEDEDRDSKKDDKQKDDDKDEEHAKALFEVNYPLGEFGLSALPAAAKAVLFKDATLWTCGPDGILERGSVLVVEGRIESVGQELDVPEDAIIVDCRGKHISPGVIDCHSHIATDGGVNESGQTITAEVRIGDFIDPNDVNIYRQLAGGVTSSNILHGSANTIGGQNQVIKFRWGALAEEMKFAEAPQGIKFALGENVKQSNFGGNSTRYPQTRMGVEQLLRDAFQAARDYQKRWDEWNAQPSGLPPRVDLELQALSEVLAGKRLVHCHSYRQDEILVLLRVCEDFGVRVATLQHILEGYKLADTIAKHGAGGSSFSDWWAYKFEVWDAIPHNGAMMHQQGVVVSFNSDDAELARRLNLEAAKAMKYGRVEKEEALKFVTLNPAKQLGIDRYVGSLEAGKHADLAVWSGEPMSVYSRCEQTWVDGRKYFDRAEDQKRRGETEAMRQALIQRALGAAGPSAEPGEEDEDKILWPREDIYCHHHDHDGEIHLHLDASDIHEE